MAENQQQEKSNEASRANQNYFSMSKLRWRPSKIANAKQGSLLVREDINFYFAAILVCPSLFNRSLESSSSSALSPFEMSTNQNDQKDGVYEDSGETFYRYRRRRSDQNRQPCIYVREPLNEETAVAMRLLKNTLDEYRALVTTVKREKIIREDMFRYSKSLAEKSMTPKLEKITAGSANDVHTKCGEEFDTPSPHVLKKDRLKEDIYRLLKQLHLENQFKEEIQKQSQENSDYHKAQQVVPGIFVGSFHPASNRMTLLSLGITHIVCCVGVSPPFVHSFDYLVLSVDDLPTSNIKRYFPQAVRFIRNAVAAGGRVLIHCGAGISRSPTVCAAFLISELFISSDSALELIRTARPFAVPNVGFLMQLREWEEQLNHRRLETAAFPQTPFNNELPASEDLVVERPAKDNSQRPSCHAQSYPNSPYCNYPYLYHSEVSMSGCDDICSLSMVNGTDSFSFRSNLGPNQADKLNIEDPSENNLALEYPAMIPHAFSEKVQEEWDNWIDGWIY
ncbi:hypothetical protein IE077_001013 [Cardiosporidium cionae]|uniref:Protein-tyrosine-phosphatase n=1 Tax=Cardiosporidium cionae TaxID=476202 RepID=A0ABQ7J623_9APIC|nr:hypothetical protein IE077_001013 [Cardiosporidium cionae]|eukprot:KAF8819455.1 hypothetical protein IE077_001013 [Cardiosporidium cionae]